MYVYDITHCSNVPAKLARLTVQYRVGTVGTWTMLHIYTTPLPYIFFTPGRS